MRIADRNVHEIVKTLEEIGRSTGTERAFRDWCECAAIALANGCDVVHGAEWQRREKRYLDIISRYGNDAAKFPGMLSCLVNAFESDPWRDHLGHVYMECFGGNKNLGQCFTPEGVCACCAGMVGVPKCGEPTTLFEPACGGGAMIIAYLKECQDAGYAWQRLLSGQDIRCVHHADGKTGARNTVDGGGIRCHALRRREIDTKRTFPIDAVAKSCYMGRVKSLKTS